MNLDQVPHPLIEDHYHIRSLIDGQEKRVADRTYHRNRVKNLEDRESTLADSKEFTVTDFFCSRCDKDFKAQVVRQIEIDWTNSGQRVAFYRTKCWRGHHCIRLITDKHRDAFWFKSKLVVRDRGLHHNDTIQPFQTGFQMLYGKK